MYEVGGDRDLGIHGGAVSVSGGVGLGAVALIRERHGLARLLRQREQGELGRSRRRLSIDRDDDVTDQQSRESGRAKRDRPR